MRGHMKYIWWVAIPLLIIQSFIVSQSPLTGWDESVYVGIGKYIYSGGESGLYESFRPMLLPLFLGFLWKIGLDPVMFGKLLILIFSIANLFLFYKISTFYLSNKESLVATFFLGITSVYFLYSIKIMTGIVALTFVLLGYHYYLRDNYRFFGLFMGLAFITRFPSGLFFFLLLFPLLFRGQPSKRLTQSIFFFFVGILPQLLINLSFGYGAVQPFIDAVAHQGNAVFDENAFFYFIELFKQNIFLLFYIPGVYLLYKQKRGDLFLLSTIPLLYFTLIINKQIRFAILFLPFIILAAMTGFSRLMYLHKRENTVTAIFVFFLTISAITTGIATLETTDGEGNDVRDFAFPEEYVVITTDPVFAAHFDNKFIPAYFSPRQALRVLETETADAYVYSDVFPCDKMDEVSCEIFKSRVAQEFISKPFLFEEEGYFVFRE